MAWGGRGLNGGMVEVGVRSVTLTSRVPKRKERGETAKGAGEKEVKGKGEQRG